MHAADRSRLPLPHRTATRPEYGTPAPCPGPGVAAPLPAGTALAVCIAALLLSACGSGGGVRQAPAPVPPAPTSPPPPPPPAPATRTVDEGLLHVQGTLTADVTIGPRGTLVLDGTIRGNVTNNGAGRFIPYTDPEPAGLVYLADGGMHMSGVVAGNVFNNGPMAVSGNAHRIGRTPANRIEGDFRQSATGILGVPLPSGDGAVSHPLSITGRADLQGGKLWLYRVCDCWDLPAEPLPTRPVSVHALHADGGVYGRFEEWISPGLFIEGSVRYGSSDVWFDLNRVSVATTMQASAFASGLAIASARNLDAALARVDGHAAKPPSPGIAQRRFLASAASLLWMTDEAQAGRALESLSGHAHASMAALLHGQVAGAASQLEARLAGVAYSPRPLAWSGPAMGMRAGQSSGGLAGGVDRWLSPRLLVGAGIGDGDASLGFGDLGGQARGEAPTASLYAHYRGDGWHATGLAGAGRATLWLQRPVVTGRPGIHTAHSQRAFEQAFAHAEVGRDLALAGGRFGPFAALDYTSLRSDRFAEQGDTGFELVGAGWSEARLSGTAGARYSRAWEPAGLPLRLELEGNYRYGLAGGGVPLRAAFGGVPDVWFDVPGSGRPDGFAGLRLHLGGMSGRRWDWSLDYARGFGGGPRDEACRLGLQRRF